MTLGPTVKDKQTGRSRFQSQLHNPVFSSPPRRPFANRSDSLSPSRSGRKTHNASRPGSSAATSRVSCSRRRPHNSRLCCSCSESPFVSNLSEVPAPPPGTWRRSHVRERQPFNIPATCASSSSRWCVFRVNAGEFPPLHFSLISPEGGATDWILCAPAPGRWRDGVPPLSSHRNICFSFSHADIFQVDM